MESNQTVLAAPMYENIDIGRRLREIFDQRKLSLRAFARYYGSSKDVIHRIMTGGRLPTKTELVNIAHHLKMPYERLLMEDTKSEMAELKRLIEEKANPKRAIKLASDLLPRALGYTEHFTILNYIGAAYHQLDHHEQAHNTWLQALPYAEKIKALLDDSECLYKITFNLIISHSERKDYLKLALLLEGLEPLLSTDDPKRYGDILFYQARLAFDRGDTELYREKMYKSAELYRMVDSKRLHFVADINIACAEYKVGNYHKAEDLFSTTVETTPSHLKDLVYAARKTYVQTLLKVKKRTKANLLIDQSLHELENLNLPRIQARFLLLRAYSRMDAESAQRVLSIEGLDDSLYLLACKCLMEHCKTIEDHGGFIEYHEMAKKYSKEKSFVEEVFII